MTLDAAKLEELLAHLENESAYYSGVDDATGIKLCQMSLASLRYRKLLGDVVEDLVSLKAMLHIDGSPTEELGAKIERIREELA